MMMRTGFIGSSGGKTFEDQAATARNTSSRRPDGARARSAGGRVIGHELAARDDERARAHGIHLFEDVRGDDDGLLLRDLADERAHLVLLQRVEAIGGLVEDQHLGVVHDGLGQADAPLEALGERVDALRDDTLELQPADDVVQPRLAVRILEAAQIRDEVQEAAHGHFGVERRAFR